MRGDFMGVSKVDFSGETLIDLTEDTVNSDNLHYGTTAHNASGEIVYGNDATNAYVLFEESENLENIESGERLYKSFGKLKKWFSKLTSIAPADILDSQEEIEANTEAGKAAGALAVQKMFGALNDNLGGCSLEQEGNDFYIIGADSVRKKLQGNNPIIISQKNIYVISNTPYVGACFVSGYNSLEFNYISATGFEDVSILKIYGQNSDPFESQKGVLLKTITKGNTVYLDITDYDYIYWSGGEKGAFYATCKLTFS